MTTTLAARSNWRTDPISHGLFNDPVTTAKIMYSWMKIWKKNRKRRRRKRK